MLLSALGLCPSVTGKCQAMAHLRAEPLQGCDMGPTNTDSAHHGPLHAPSSHVPPRTTTPVNHHASTRPRRSGAAWEWPQFLPVYRPCRLNTCSRLLPRPCAPSASHRLGFTRPLRLLPRGTSASRPALDYSRPGLQTPFFHSSSSPSAPCPAEIPLPSPPRFSRAHRCRCLPSSSSSFSSSLALPRSKLQVSQDGR